MGMSESHKAAMQAGRRRMLDAKAEHARRRVEAFTTWLKAGSRLRDIPEVPTDDDYRLARR